MRRQLQYRDKAQQGLVRAVGAYQGSADPDRRDLEDSEKSWCLVCNLLKDEGGPYWSDSMLFTREVKF